MLVNTVIPFQSESTSFFQEPSGWLIVCSIQPNNASAASLYRISPLSRASSSNGSIASAARPCSFRHAGQSRLPSRKESWVPFTWTRIIASHIARNINLHASSSVMLSLPPCVDNRFEGGGSALQVESDERDDRIPTSQIGVWGCLDHQRNGTLAPACNPAPSPSFVSRCLLFIGRDERREANGKRGEEIAISTADSKVKVYVVPTNEELAIARDTVALV